MGRVKEPLPEDDEYSAYADFGYEQELEMLAAEKDAAMQRWISLIEAFPIEPQRTDAQEREVQAARAAALMARDSFYGANHAR